MNHSIKIAILLLLVLAYIPTSINSNPPESQVEKSYKRLELSDIEFGSLSEGENDMYNFVVLNTATQLLLSLNGPSGADFDLYLRLNQQPTTYNYDYCATTTSSDETIMLSNPTAGIWYVMVYAYSGSGQYSLTLSVDYPEPEPEPSTSTPPPSSTGSSSSTNSPPVTNPTIDESESSRPFDNPLVVIGLFIAGAIGVLWVIKTRPNQQR